jgi:hypothetical protein
VVFTFLVHYCDVRYNCRIQLCSIRLSLQLFVGALMSYFCYMCLLAHSCIQHVLTIWVTRRVSYKKQKLLTRREYLGSPPVCGEVRIAHLFSFLFSVFFWLCLSSSYVLCAQCCHCLCIAHSWLPLRFSLTFSQTQLAHIAFI